MRSLDPLIALPLATGVVLFGFAFVVAPRSCEGGLDAYVTAATIASGAMLVLPFVLRRQRAPWRSAILSLGLAGLVLAVAVAGLFAANVRIICRLI